MPDWYYYQVNGKTIQENYIAIHRQRQQQYRKMLEERKLQQELEKEIDAAAEAAITKALNKLFPDG